MMKEEEIKDKIEEKVKRKKRERLRKMKGVGKKRKKSTVESKDDKMGCKDGEERKK